MVSMSHAYFLWGLKENMMPKDASFTLDVTSTGQSHPVTLESLLVELYDSHRLYDLAVEKNSESRAELARIVTNLLNADLKLNEREQIADILISLMRQAEADLRAAIAERLAIHENVPLRLVLFLANDDIGVAESVLRQSPVLNDLDLLYIIQSRTAAYWRAIAGRSKLHAPVIDALADTKDIPTARTLAENISITLTDYAAKTLGDLAQDEVDLARPLLQRRDVPEQIARKIYQAVGNQLRDTLNTIVTEDTNKAILSTVEDVISEMTAQVAEPQHPFMPTAAMLKAAHVFADQRKLTLDLMQKTLKRGQFASFVAQFSVLVRTTPHFTIEMLLQNDGQMMAAACRAQRFTREQFISLYLLTQRMRSHDGMLNHRAFNAAVSYFDRISQSLGQSILSKHQIA
jgi:uncharacterized protein (DUF2336 family)